MSLGDLLFSVQAVFADSKRASSDLEEKQGIWKVCLNLRSRVGFHSNSKSGLPGIHIFEDR